MSEVTVIGLGPMGTALAKVLLKAKHQVTVWNRNPEKTEQSGLEDARKAVTLQEAVAASPVVIVCINNYTTTTELFDTEQVWADLESRIIVQFSTGTPGQACESETWFNQHNAKYLDGVILGAPFSIGTDTGKILIGGDEENWVGCQHILKCLVGNLLYTGGNIESAAILDLAWLSQRFGLFMGAFQGMLLCEASGIDLDIYASTITSDDRVKMLANAVHTNNYDKPVNTIDVWRDALHHIQSQAQVKEINSEFLDLVGKNFEHAQLAGYGKEDLAAMIKIFRGNG